jgi:hypothetical protein
MIRNFLTSYDCSYSHFAYGLVILMTDFAIFHVVLIKGEVHNVKNFELKMKTGLIVFVKFCPVFRILLVQVEGSVIFKVSSNADAEF